MGVMCAKFEVNRLRRSRVRVMTDRQTDGRTDGRTDIPNTIARFFLKLRERAKKAKYAYNMHIKFSLNQLIFDIRSFPKVWESLKKYAFYALAGSWELY